MSLNYGQYYTATDDVKAVVARQDISGGENTRIHPQNIGQNQVKKLQNVDVGTVGKRIKRKGSVLISDDMGTESVVYLHNYVRQGYTDQLIAVEDDNLNAIEEEGNHTEVKGDFTAAQIDWGILNAKESGIVPDDVIIVQNGQDNPYRIHKDSSDIWNVQDLGSTAGTGSDSPPKSQVMSWYNNRIWVLKNDQLYWSSAYASDYSTAFDTVTDWFRVPVGEERGISTTRDAGLVIMGENEIWGLVPQNTPTVNDQPQPLVTDHGVVSKGGWLQAGDDIYYFAKDGFRALRRTIQDKLQVGASYPLSFVLKDEFEAINWAYINRLKMDYFDNKIFVSVPTGASTYSVWVYYPATQGWMIIDGWNPRSMTTQKVDGEERLYYGTEGDGKVFRGWYGYTDEGTTTTNGTAIEFDEYGREEDFGMALVEKVGGEIEVEVEGSTYDGEVQVYCGSDGNEPIYLGAVSTNAGTAPTLPVDLPFSLGQETTIRKKFNLDQLGTYRTLQYRLYNNQSNTDDVIVKAVSFVTFPEEYQSDER